MPEVMKMKVNYTRFFTGCKETFLLGDPKRLLNEDAVAVQVISSTTFSKATARSLQKK
jgi:hypothetical protein